MRMSSNTVMLAGALVLVCCCFLDATNPIPPGTSEQNASVLPLGLPPNIAFTNDIVAAKPSTNSIFRVGP